MNSKIIDFYKKLPEKRFGTGEILATDMLLEFLAKGLNINNNQITIQKFENSVPINQDYALEIAEKKILSTPICFFSGNLDNSLEIIEFEDNREFGKSYLAHNKYCNSLSRHAFFEKASFAILPKDYKFAIENFKGIAGFVEIEKFEYVSRNILVGNTSNPKSIIFCHLDTVEKGFIDNLSGVIAMLDVLSRDLTLLDNNLFVFSGNEELSYEFPTYWGYGYRRFEDEYYTLLEESKNIIVADCIGQTEIKVYKDRATIPLGFPIKQLEKVIDKVQLVAGDLGKLMSIYHSDLDTESQMNWNYFNKSVDYIFSLLNK